MWPLKSRDKHIHNWILVKTELFMAEIEKPMPERMVNPYDPSIKIKSTKIYYRCGCGMLKTEVRVGEEWTKEDLEGK